MIEKILFVSDGIIAVTAEGFHVPEKVDDDIYIKVRDFGAEIIISGVILQFPVTVLEHLEKAVGTNVYFYESTSYALVAAYLGNIVLDRDELLKVKGAWEYSQAPAMISEKGLEGIA